MSLPNILKNFNLYADGESLMGVAEEITVPKLSRKMEEWQGGGMPGPIDIDLSQEKIVMDWTTGGLLISALRKYGASKPDALLLRYSGAYQREDTGVIHAVEIVVRGRHKEIDMGNKKVGEPNKTKVSTTCAYYKLTVDNEVLIEYDALAMILVVDGEDLMDAQRKAIGLA